MAEPISSFDTAPFVALAETFQNFRSSSGKERPAFPLPLRRRAVEALRAGGALTSVSSACGVAPQTLRNWSALIPPAPRRLCVAPADGALTSALLAPETSANIISDGKDMFEFHLACGVRLEASPQQTLWLACRNRQAKGCGSRSGSGPLLFA